MRYNLINSIKKRDNESSLDSLLHQYILKIRGNSVHTLQLWGALEYITFLKKETSVAKVEAFYNSLISIQLSL